MSDNLRSGFAPRTIAAARTRRTIAARLLMRIGFRRFKRWLSRQVGRLDLARQRWRDMDMLLRADERVLKDIGLTRGDAQAMAEAWLSSSDIAKAAAARRDEAIAASAQRRAMARKAMAATTMTGAAVAGTISAPSRVPMNDNSQSCPIAANASGS